MSSAQSDSRPPLSVDTGMRQRNPPAQRSPDSSSVTEPAEAELQTGAIAQAKQEWFHIQQELPPQITRK